MPEILRVRTEDELASAVALLKQRLPSTLLLFRGQTALHETIRSGRARSGASSDDGVDMTWTSIANFVFDSPEDTEAELARALLQHYGLPTHFVDLTADARVAAWFSMNDYAQANEIYAGSRMRFFTAASYTRRSTGTGYVLVFGFNDPGPLMAQKSLFDLSVLPAACARPHAQKGWLFYDHPPIQPQPKDFWIATIEIDAATFGAGFTVEELFPPPQRDRAYGRLLSAPFVRVPSPTHEGSVGSLRLIDVPEYKAGEDATLRHKWCDFTIYEPDPAVHWYNWHFDLATVHQGLRGDIAKSVKLVIAPGALRAMILTSQQGSLCKWPALGTDSLFFVLAAVDHDKDIDHGPPYEGVWLTRDHDLILEHPLDCEADRLSVRPGHGFRIARGALQRVPTANSCGCPFPDSHNERVHAMLSMQGLIDAGQLVIAPHPLRTIACFVVFDPAGDLLEEALEHLQIRYSGHFPR